MSFAEIVFTVVNLIIAMIIGGSQIYIAKKVKDFEVKQDNRDEQRRTAQVYADATKFIQKYGRNGCRSEIYLIPLCIAAYKYNPIYPYRREIYRDFCSLTEDVQNEIISRFKLNLKSYKIDNYYQVLLSKLRYIIKENYPNDIDIYYKGGKYLYRALRNHGGEKIPQIRCAIDEQQQKFLSLKTMSDNTDTDMDYKSHIDNLMFYNKKNTPIKSLWYEETNIGSPQSGNEILPSYLCCMVAKYASIYSDNSKENDRNIDFADNYEGVQYMEDLFLDALHTIENYNIEEK